MWFRGHSEHAMDGKGRTCLPAKFRDTLAKNGESQLVVTRGYASDLPNENGHCLFLYPLGDFEELQREIDRLKKESAQVGNADKTLQRTLHWIERTTVAYAEDLEFDKLGRILIPANLRQWAGIEKEIVCVGQGKRMELWNPQRWSHVEAMADGEDLQSIDRERVAMEIGF